MHICVPSARCQWGPEEGVTSSGTEVVEVYEPSCEELNPGSLQEQEVLLTGLESWLSG